MLGLKADSENRYQSFLKKIAQTKTVYVLSNGEIFGSCFSHEFVMENGQIIPIGDASVDAEEVPLIPFWSNKAYPTQWLKNGVEGESFSVMEITLREFFNILCHYEELNFSVGIEWNQHGVGKEVKASVLLDEIENLVEESSGIKE